MESPNANTACWFMFRWEQPAPVGVWAALQTPVLLLGSPQGTDSMWFMSCCTCCKQYRQESLSFQWKVVNFLLFFDLGIFLLLLLLFPYF